MPCFKEFFHPFHPSTDTTFFCWVDVRSISPSTQKLLLLFFFVVVGVLCCFLGITIHPFFLVTVLILELLTYFFYLLMYYLRYVYQPLSDSSQSSSLQSNASDMLIILTIKFHPSSSFHLIVGLENISSIAIWNCLSLWNYSWVDKQ